MCDVVNEEVALINNTTYKLAPKQCTFISCHTLRLLFF